MFIGSVDAGYRAADLMTLVSSAVRNDLDVFAYFKDVLDRLLAGDTDYNALRPDVWKQSHPEAIRTYRVEKRLARADDLPREGTEPSGTFPQGPLQPAEAGERSALHFIASSSANPFQPLSGHEGSRHKN